MRKSKGYKTNNQSLIEKQHPNKNYSSGGSDYGYGVHQGPSLSNPLEQRPEKEYPRENLYSSAYCIAIVITVSALLLLRFIIDHDNSATLGFYIHPIISTLILPLLFPLSIISLCCISSLPWNRDREGWPTYTKKAKYPLCSAMSTLGLILALFIYKENPYYTPVFIILFISAMCLVSMEFRKREIF